MGPIDLGKVSFNNIIELFSTPFFREQNESNRSLRTKSCENLVTPTKLDLNTSSSADEIISIDAAAAVGTEKVKRTKASKNMERLLKNGPQTWNQVSHYMKACERRQKRLESDKTLFDSPDKMADGGEQKKRKLEK